MLSGHSIVKENLEEAPVIRFVNLGSFPAPPLRPFLPERRMAARRDFPMKPMYLRSVEKHEPAEPHATIFSQMRGAGIPIPQILHLFAFKPERTDHLARFTQGVMRGPSPLLPGQRELIAALTSKLNQCLF